MDDDTPRPLDDLRCIGCGSDKTLLRMLNIKEIETSEHPSIFLAYAKCDACDEDECGRRVLASLATIVRCVDENKEASK